MFNQVKLVQILDTHCIGQVFANILAFFKKKFDLLDEVANPLEKAEFWQSLHDDEKRSEKYEGCPLNTREYGVDLQFVRQDLQTIRLEHIQIWTAEEHNVLEWFSIYLELKIFLTLLIRQSKIFIQV